ncbi:phosphoenolpyruvate synthase [Candidatus Saccharibacteria bacterium]|jgi:pyruvate,water dikinase|nr:MAG: phosphoenolpyruvate synthase [Candidatus Saccharibacteria bacterium]
MYKYLKFFEELSIGDIPQVGGKNASLGEMYHHLRPQGVNLPNGVATTADAYRYFLEQAGLNAGIEEALYGLDVSNVHDLASRGARIRQMIVDAKLPDDFEEEIKRGYRELCEKCGHGDRDMVVAIRSSATAEDLPNASFAGQQATFLNIKGEHHVLESVKECIASLFTDRAIVYRVTNGFDHMKVALSVGIQQMVAVKSECAGVMFTIDTESGFKNAVVVSSIYGLGENIVQGHVSPDEFIVFKPTRAILKRHLGTKKMKMIPVGGSKTKNIAVSQADQDRYSINDDQVRTLADWGIKIEQHYGHPMDIEWALDEDDKQLYIVQARAETVQSRRDANVVEEYKLKGEGNVIVTGTSVGNKIGNGRASKIMSVKDIDDFKEGDVLVTEMTDPDWVPIMKIASAIVTDKGGRTCHAAIVSRELGIPCVVGTGNASEIIKDGQSVTVSCGGGGDEGHVYDGIIEFEVQRTDIKDLERPKTKIMMNIGSPDHAFAYSLIPNDGVGLAREEFIIDSHIKIHPQALLHFDQVKDKAVRAQINKLTKGYDDKAQYFIDKLAEGIAIIGAAFHPNPVIVRFSDFKTNEYANLIGGTQFEPSENNPMIGWRGASRYYSEQYRDAFKLECQAFLKVRNEMGLTNVKAMVPFCRSIDEAKKVQEVMAETGLRRGENGFELYVMVEIPANVILAEQFADLFDGFSIGSNDLTQLTLGVDRDNHTVAHVYDENNEAVKILIREAVRVAKAKGRKIGLCGQAPSDYPEFARFLVETGIDSISLAPDTIVKTTIDLKQTENNLGR